MPATHTFVASDPDTAAALADIYLQSEVLQAEVWLVNRRLPMSEYPDGVYYTEVERSWGRVHRALCSAASSRERPTHAQMKRSNPSGVGVYHQRVGGWSGGDASGGAWQLV